MKMQNILPTLLVFLLAGVTFSQVPSQLVGNWRFYRSEVDEFVIESPTVLKSSGELDAKSSRMYFETLNGTYFYVFSDPVKAPENRRMVANFVNSSGLVQLPNNEPIKAGGISFTDSTGYHHQIVEVRSNSRIYIAQTISKVKENAFADRFLSSLKLLASPPNTTATVNSPSSEAMPDGEVRSNAPDAGPPNTLNAADGTLQGSGSGSGLGNGNGPGEPGAAALLPKTPSGKSLKLRILSKAKPSYTDFARFYQISGTVILRVTFLKEGKIGSISAVTTLPFGLTERAIEAARQIRFEPATTDGSAVSVVKLVEYTFMIY